MNILNIFMELEHSSVIWARIRGAYDEIKDLSPRESLLGFVKVERDERGRELDKYLIDPARMEDFERIFPIDRVKLGIPDFSSYDINVVSLRLRMFANVLERKAKFYRDSIPVGLED